MKKIVLMTMVSFSVFCFAGSGIVPFTGLRYEENGLRAKDFKGLLDGKTWTSNRLPVNKEFEIGILKPSGFKAKENGFFPGIEILFTNDVGDTLFYTPNLFDDQKQLEGLSESQLSNLSYTFTLTDVFKPDDHCLIKARFFDAVSKNELTTWLDIYVVDDSLPLDVTEATTAFSSTLGYKVNAGELRVDNASVTQETLKKENMRNVIANAFITDNFSEKEWNDGRHEVIFYDKNLRIIPINAQPIQKIVQRETGIEVTSTISYASNAPVYVRYRWQSNIASNRVIEFLFELKK